LFCINSKSGAIYATKQTDEVDLHGQMYNLTIGLTSHLQQIFYQIQIKFTDVYRPANNLFKELTKQENQCWRHQTSFATPNPEGRWFLRHKPDSSSVRILGITLSSLLFTNKKGKYEIVVTHQETFQKFVLTFQVENTKSNIQIPAYQINVNSDNFVYLVELSFVGIEGNRVPVVIKHKTLTMHLSTSWSFCRNLECLNKFRKWNDTLAAINDDRYKDKDFLQVYYGRCTSRLLIFVI